MLFVLTNLIFQAHPICNPIKTNLFLYVVHKGIKPGLIWKIGLTNQNSGFNHTDTIDTIYCVKDMIHVLIV